MKQLFFGLSILCFGAGVTSTPVQAFPIPAPTRATLAAAGLTLLFVGPFVKKIIGDQSEVDEEIKRDKGQPLPEQQVLFAQICKKMNLDDKKITLINSSSTGNIGGENPIVGLGVEEGIKDLSSEELSYVMAHELGHIKNHDEIVYERIAYANLVASSLCAVPIARLIARSNCNLVAKGLAACAYFVFSKKALDSFSSYQSRRLEKRADLTAVTALGSKKGAIDFFNRGLKGNLAINRFFKNMRDESLLNNPSLALRIRWNLISLYLKNFALNVDEHGNNLMDTEHPLTTERIAYCDANAEKSGRA
jgi:Zn-dependent protease with chaperone function